MPLITINTALKLEKNQKDTLKTKLGQLISILPGKEEKGLMVDISDNHSMYLRGEEKKSCAFVEVRIKGTADFNAKQELTKAIFALLEECLGIKNDEAYINFLEFEYWGSRGILKP
jgi:hypothetical protein